MAIREVIVMHEETIYRYKEDVEEKIYTLMKKMDTIRESTPHFYLEIDKAAFILPALFNTDGTPKGNFIVPEHIQKKALYALKKTNTTSLGKIWYGNDRNAQYLIKVTPDFLSEDEFNELLQRHSITKLLGNTTVKLMQPKHGMNFVVGQGWQMNYGANLSDMQRKKISGARKLLQECSLAIAELREIQAKLPSAPHK